MMTRKVWEKIGGLNPLYVGWGLEDDDTRQRVRAWDMSGLDQNQRLELFLYYHMKIIIQKLKTITIVKM